MPQQEQRNRSEAVYRAITGIILVALTCGTAILSLSAVQMLDPSRLFGNWSWGFQLFAFMDGMAWTTRLGIAAGSTIAGMLFLVLLIRLMSPVQSTAALHMLEADDRGFVAVESRGISTIAAQAAMSAHGVMDANVNVRGSGATPVGLKIDIGVYPGASVKRSGNEVRERVSEAVERLVGIDVKSVSVRAHVLEPDALTRIIR